MEDTPIFATVLERQVAARGPDSHYGRVLAAFHNARAVNQNRRAAVLKHDDLAARLTQPPIGYHEPEQWNGYIPPDTFNIGLDELLRDTRGWTQPWNGRRAMGTVANNSPRRAALLELSAEAWQREHQAKEAAA